MCSTPYGIRGSALAPLCRGVYVFWVCSTPYGIRGSALQNGANYSLSFKVLNALWHQRFGTPIQSTWKGIGSLCSTPYGIRGSAPVYGVQFDHCYDVLNALWHQRFGTGSTELRNCPWPGAQRLMASEVRHAHVLSNLESPWLCSTPYGIRGSAHHGIIRYRAVRRRVLNALWHQRFGTNSIVIAHPDLKQCSTPYGIRGSARLLVRQGQMASHPVLNALWHQRFGTSQMIDRNLPWG